MVLDRTAKLDGFEGQLVSGSARLGEWSGDLDVELLIHLLQVAAAGREVALDVSGGVRTVVLRACRYDVEEGAVRVSFEASGIAA